MYVGTILLDCRQHLVCVLIIEVVSFEGVTIGIQLGVLNSRGVLFEAVIL